MARVCCCRPVDGYPEARYYGGEGGDLVPCALGPIQVMCLPWADPQRSWRVRCGRARRGGAGRVIQPAPVERFERLR